MSWGLVGSYQFNTELSGEFVIISAFQRLYSSSSQMNLVLSWEELQGILVSVPSTGDHWKQKPSLANRLGVQLPGFRELVDQFWIAGGKTFDCG